MSDAQARGPLSDEYLAEMRMRASEYERAWDAGQKSTYALGAYWTDVTALLAEVERLRHAFREEETSRISAIADLRDAMAEVEQLRAQNAALREIAQAVATYELVTLYIAAVHGVVQAHEVTAPCTWCGRGDPHTDTCPVTKARAWLAGQETTRDGR